MREISQICPLSGAMVKDVAPKFIDSSKGQVIERVNLRNSGLDGDTFVNKKFKGTVLVSAPLPTSGTNKAIGKIKDTQNDALLYFIYNSLGNHCVFRYMTKTKVLQNIWLNKPALGLQDKPVKGQVVEGKVYWVNGTGKQPKAFDLTRAYNYTNSVSSTEIYTTSDIARADFFLYATEPPKFAPKVEYGSDLTLNFNNLRKKLFQFKYAYQYFDDQISSWSPISKMPIPTNEIYSTGSFVEEITKNNKITVTVNPGSRLVKKILVAARDTNPRNAGSFFQFAEIDRSLIEEGNQTETVEFYNNKVTKSIDTEIGNRYSDNMPLSGNDMLLLSNKYLSISLPEYGYDNIETDYTLAPYEESKDFQDRAFYDDMTVDTSYSQKLQGWGLTWGQIDAIWLPDVFVPNATYEISFTVMGSYHFFFQISAGTTYEGYPGTMRGAFLTQIYNKVTVDLAAVIDNFYIENIMEPCGILAQCDDPTGIALGFSLMDIPPSGAFVSNLKGEIYQDVRSSMPAYKNLKRGQYHPFALIYNDSRGRYNVVQGDEELYSPLYTSNTVEDTNKLIRSAWEINHRPPVEAVAYRWCYIRNKSYTYFEYFYQPRSILGTGVEGNGIPTGKYFIALNQSLQRIRDLYPNFIISDYVWQNGDRIRLAGEDISYEILKEYLWIDPTPDTSITGEGGWNGFLIDVELGEDVAGIPNMKFLPLVEVYRQNPSPQDNIYLEIGEEFEILEPGTANRRHAGQITNQSADLTIAATGIFDFGDVYLRGRVFVGADQVPLFLPIEHEYLSDYYRSDSIDVGRAGAKIESKNKVLNRIARSENYIEDTEYNNLNVWLAGTDFHTASNVDGPITGMELAGDVLKVIQTHKESSIYVGKTEVRDGGGQQLLTLSDNVFTNPRIYEEFRGTNYRNSLVANERNIYYFDESTGEFIRSSPNGQEAISTVYGYKSYFEKKAKTLREYSGHKDVIVGINNDYKEVYVSFIMGTTNETVVFSEDPNTKGWKSFIVLSAASGVPELFAGFGDRMFSFLNGNLYVHDSGDTLNEFYGEQKSFSIKVPINNLGHETKRFRNIQINSDQNVYDIQFDIPASNTYRLQKSILKPSVMRTTNNRIVADILRNIINELGQENLNLLYDGQKLIGEHVIVTLSGTGPDEIELREIEVKSLIST